MAILMNIYNICLQEDSNEYIIMFCEELKEIILRFALGIFLPNSVRPHFVTPMHFLPFNKM